ncbi:DNA/RNA nuclease SfsA [Porticoccus litoralis]|uniref:Sugar fermentation stimulation protein homolog n=1 Tax=Porticoccus litoralis TaxID=434086 RepID=A0AAW8B2U7_9GAMM|nr:DNA/RNA nuclease SfsA [Porticoccus litoralis]MDP1520315.1 DNA/RNA nuclease SfsA [Porticoccus litoralis]
MKIEPPLEQAILLKRYKRFLADIRLANGEEMTIHCPNTGSMKNCWAPETPCWFSRSNDPKRKLPGTLEITSTPDGFLAGVNTGRPNKLVREAIESGVIAELQEYSEIRPEVKYGDENSRIDLLLIDGERRCYVEVKNTTLGVGDGRVLFPDAVTTRGAKHLRELMAMVEQGHRAVLVFCVQHSGAQSVGPADEIDPVYGQTLREAMDAGVEVLAYGCDLSAEEISLRSALPFYL